MATFQDELNAFMAAVSGQESGGDYTSQNGDSGAYGRFQIMPENWPSWAEAAGLGSNAPQTAANQDYVAAWKMSELYQMFGNWSDVAKSWYAGTGWTQWSEAARNTPIDSSGRLNEYGQYPSVNGYADSVISKMKNYVSGVTGGTSVPPSSTTSKLTTNNPLSSTFWSGQITKIMYIIGGLTAVVVGFVVLIHDTTPVQVAVETGKKAAKDAILS